MINKFKYWCLSLYFILCGISILYADLPKDHTEIELYDKGHKMFIQINLNQKKITEIRILQKDSIIKPLTTEGVDLKEIPRSFLSNYFEIKKDLYWVTVLGTGQVYEFNLKTSNFKRIDKTYFRGYNFLPIQFLHNDTLFSFGGMGFWHGHNITTFYDKKTNEWEFYSTSKNLPERFSARLGGYHSKTRTVYTAQMPDIYQEQDKYPSYLYAFHFQTNSWEKLGKIARLPQGFWDHERLETRWVDPFIFSEELEDFFIDVEENKIYKIKDPLKLKFHGVNELVVNGDYLYFFKKHNENNYKIEIDSISFQELKKNSDEIGSFYIKEYFWNETNSLMLMYGLAILAIILLIFLLVKYRRKITLLENLSDNTPPEYYDDFIKFILANPDHSCSTHDLNDVIRVAEKPLDTQRHYRSKFIGQVNQFILIEHGIEEGIERSTSSSDKRFVYYKASENLLKKLKGF